MKDAKDVIPWEVTDISFRPFDGFWSFNPSISFDGETWRCVLRCADYCMEDGITRRSKSVGPAGQQTKNAMVILDPTSWRPIEIFKMHERDGLPRAPTPHRGFEDMRIFRTDKGGLQGIAASLHLVRDREPHVSEFTGMPQYQPPEQVLLSFDENYDIVAAQPIRGSWNGPEKNWVPFHDVAEPRFLYSIEKGLLFDDRGRLHGDEARVRSSIRGHSLAATPTIATPTIAAPTIAARAVLPEPSPEQKHDRRREDRAVRSKKKSGRRPMIRGGDVRVVRGGRVKLDTMTSRPSSRPSSRSSQSAPARSTDDSTRAMGSGRVLLPTYEGLRGGTQLIRVGDDAWLGVGHEMRWANSKKLYWHTFYVVDSRGKMTAASEPIKLAPNGIEFAAGMAIDGDRVVVSFGVDDMNSMLGETRLSAVMAILRPVER